MERTIEVKSQIGISSQRGSALLNILVISSGFVLVLFYAQQWLTNKLVENKSKFLAAKVEHIQKKIIATLENEVAWQLTMNHPSNGGMFACLATNSCPVLTLPLTSGQPRFSLYHSHGTLLTDSRQLNHGFTLNGESCETFSDSSSSEECAVRYDIVWGADCASCSQSIRFYGEVVLSDQVRLNTARYTIDFVRGLREGTLASNCAQFGGTLNEEGDCILPFMNDFRCPQGQAMVGVDSNSQRICRPIPGILQSCPNGIRDFTTAGDLVCI